MAGRVRKKPSKAPPRAKSETLPRTKSAATRSKPQTLPRLKADTLRAHGIPTDPASAGWRVVRRNRYHLFAVLGAPLCELERPTLEALRAVVGAQVVARVADEATRVRIDLADRAIADQVTRDLAAIGLRVEQLVEPDYLILPPPGAPPLTVDTERAMQRLVRRLVERGVVVENEEF
ncbi:MAG TPA: hypothetical protein VLB44_02705 [Kofleriaceae bacterium]|nr:hypothetical protein [Kofleriaceae bacterium]